MKKFLLAVIFLVAFSVPVFASVNVQTDGTNLGPAQDINFVNGTVSGQGSPTKTVNLSKVTTDEYIYVGRATSNPCSVANSGYIFFNDTTGEPCYCDNTANDIKFEDGSTSCF